MARKKVARTKTEEADVLAGLRPDLGTAAARLGSRLRDPGELAGVSARLDADEIVRFVALGTLERSGGIVVLTDARLLFFPRRVMQPTLDLPLGAVESLATSSGLSTGEVAMRVGDGVVAVSRIVKPDLDPLADAIRRAREVAPDVAVPPTGQGAVDPFAAMARLSALRDQGVLTEAEFAAKKQELLDRL